MGLPGHANVVSIQGRRTIHRAGKRRGGSCRRLSAGLRVSAGTHADATAALRARIRSIENCTRGAGEGACLLRAAEAAIDEVAAFLDPVRGGVTESSAGEAPQPLAAANCIDRLGESSRVRDIDAAVHTLLITDENHSTAESRIRDVAVACETARRTRDSILQHASIALLSQANALPRSAQRLLD